MVNVSVNSIVRSLVFCLAICLASSGAASAASSVSWSPADIGESQMIVFDGVSPAYQGGSVPVPGLHAQLVLTLDSISNNTWTFGYSLTNTSAAPITTSRVTVFGFDIPQGYAGVTSTGLFSDPGAGATQLVGNRDLCFRTINFGQCVGSYFGGVGKGHTASGIFNLNYASAQVGVMLDHLFVAYQGVSAPAL